MRAFIFDTFSGDGFAGNPAAVVDLRGLTIAPSRMQAIASSLGQPTTAFVDQTDADRIRVRWFTPEQELMLCGHATLASAAYFYDIRQLAGSVPLIFETPSTDLRAARAGDLFALDLPAMTLRRVTPPQGLDQMLGARIQACFRAVDDILVDLASEDAVASLRPDFSALKTVECRGIIVTASSQTPGTDFVSRTFFPRLGVDEDQVCVSAHCKLVPLWSERLLKTRMSAVQLSKRGGRLRTRYSGDTVQVLSNVDLSQVVDLTSPPGASNRTDHLSPARCELL